MASAPLVEIIINKRRFAVDGENAPTIALSGYTNEFKMNGDAKTGRSVKGVKAGRIAGVPVVIEEDRDDMEFLQEVMDSPEDAEGSTTDINDVVHDFIGQIVDDPEKDVKEGTMELAINGIVSKQN